ncbi:MAG: hypothetical protein KAG84_08005 [Bacteroidales bacterium]|nr:hypothetical protein [Bacteroidales bacterium]
METINDNHRSEVMSVKDWLVTMLVVAIPLVGFIMIFVWAFGDSANRNKANWAKASLLLLAIVLGIYALVFALFGMAFLAGTGIQ